jgi:hypothetical protein
MLLLLLLLHLLLLLLLLLPRLCASCFGCSDEALLPFRRSDDPPPLHGSDEAARPCPSRSPPPPPLPVSRDSDSDSGVLLVLLVLVLGEVGAAAVSPLELELGDKKRSSGTWLVSCTSAQSMAGPCQQIRTASVLLACVAFGGGAPWWCQNRHTAHAAPRPPAQLAHPRQTRWPSGGGAALVAPIFSRGHRVGWSVE